MPATKSATATVPIVTGMLTGLPVFLAGSSASAARTPGFELAYDDIDVFCSSPQSLISAAERLRSGGFEITDRYKRVYHRWMKHGFKGWHTNSLKLEGHGGVDVNLVYKLVDKHPTTSLAQVIESFDFGLLAHGFDCETQVWRDMREYLFPQHEAELAQAAKAFTVPPSGNLIQVALPMMPIRRDDWRNGFISQYQGLREIGRFLRYNDYGYDMSLVYDDLLTGYKAASLFYSARTDKPELEMIGKIFESIAMSLEDSQLSGDWDKLREASEQIIFLDDLDAIMEALE